MATERVQIRTRALKTSKSAAGGILRSARMKHVLGRQQSGKPGAVKLNPYYGSGDNLEPQTGVPYSREIAPQKKIEGIQK